MSGAAVQTWTIGSLLKWTEDFLRSKTIESPRLDAQVLLAHVLGCTRSELYVRFQETPAEDAKAKFRELIRRRVEGTPVSYLVGQKEFFLLKFEVTPEVLVPRPATETLVLAALDALKGVAEPRVLDVGTGSGCIAISLATRMKSAKFVSIDISSVALDVAQRNAKRHGVEKQIDFRAGDLFGPLRPGEHFDVIVSNPPYVPTGDLPSLPPEVRDREPRLALDGGESGFAVIDRLIAGAGEWLKPAGKLIFEFGAGQSEQVISKLIESRFVPGRPILDSENIARVVVAHKA
ncbi:MAG: peptide chain release factor N(5)-glutamine methyltransferase [Gemmataceae bacterium]